MATLLTAWYPVLIKMMIGHPMLDLVDGMVRLVALLLSVNNQIVFFLDELWHQTFCFLICDWVLDPDMLEVGNGGMSTEEYRSHFSIWALMKVLEKKRKMIVSVIVSVAEQLKDS